jgi:glucosyl-dolichyl phosphate glucuronosyltransferase
MKITLIVATYNRCRILAETLEGIANSWLPDSVSWQVLVVDNNSHDQTREIVEGFIRRHPGRFRYLFEPRQGKSYALNTGLRHARGDVIAFTDDDVTVEPTWLWNLTAVLYDDKWAGTGGRIFPSGTLVPPPWMPLKDSTIGGPLFGLFDRGDKPGKLAVAPHGGNMAFRKAMFEKYGGFRTDLGPPPCDLGGEDTEFGYRLMAFGERLWYEPAAVVRHPIAKDRLEKKYFLGWWFRQGRGNVRKKGERPPLWRIPRNYIGISNRILRLLPMGTLRWIKASNPPVRFKRMCRVWMIAGETLEMLRQLRGGRLDYAIESSDQPSPDHNASFNWAGRAFRIRWSIRKQAANSWSVPSTTYAATDAKPPITNIHTSRQTPIFSIILPTRDRPRMLQRAVSSVCRQSLRDFELIVIDDGSAQPLVSFPRDSRIRIIRNRSSFGVAEARNIGIDAAKGRYISFLDDDDEYLRSFLSSTYASLKNTHEGVGGSWCGVKFIDYPAKADGVPKVRIKKYAAHRHRQTLLSDFLSIGAGYGVTIKAECLRRVGQFNNTLKIGEDTDLFLRILVHGFMPVAVPGVHVVCHNHGEPRLTCVAMHQEIIQTWDWLLVEYSDFLFEHPNLKNGFREYVDSLRKSKAESDGPVLQVDFNTESVLTDQSSR